MKSKMVNLTLVAFALIVLGMLAFHVRVGATADSVAVLKTTGMTCGACSKAIVKSLGKMKGVAATEVDMEGGWVIVAYDTKCIKPESLAENVKKAGFDSTLHEVLTPEQFRQVTGRDIGMQASAKPGCCGGKGQCGMSKKP
jgi:periplasmic mercuric ion binding protein